MADAIAAGDGVILREQAARIKELEARVAALEQDEEGVLMERYWEAKLKEKNMSEHTPGPWERVGNSIKSRKAGCVIVRLPALTDRVGDETPKQIERWDADARLIAAAPELLESLKMMLEMSEMGGFGKAYAEDVARAAIAKAKGE